MSASLDGRNEVVTLVNSGVRCPSSLRLDLPRRTLYWVDPELGVISSLMLDHGHRRVRLDSTTGKTTVSVHWFAK